MKIMINDARLVLSTATIHFDMEDNSDLQILFIATSIFLVANTVSSIAVSDPYLQISIVSIMTMAVGR